MKYFDQNKIEYQASTMSKEETVATKAEPKSQINLEDLAVDEARQNEVKGGGTETQAWEY
jgi:hypothetical protein